MTDVLDRFAFGDSAQSADALLALVLAGTKTATCGPLREYTEEQVALPRAGERSVVLDGKGDPACVIEITGVRCTPFSDVDEVFARAEGEGDRNLASWRMIHRDFFERHGGFSPDMMLVCQNFRVVERHDGSAQP